MWNLGLRVESLGFRVSFGVQDSGFQVQGQGSGLRVEGLGFWVSRFRISGSCFGFRIWSGFVSHQYAKRHFFIDNLLVRTRFIIAMIKWTGLAP